jgi:hypothetical protein
MTYAGVETELHAFLTSAPDGGEWSASRPGRFTAGEGDSGTYWIGVWVGLSRPGHGGGKEKNSLHLPGIEPR